MIKCGGSRSSAGAVGDARIMADYDYIIVGAGSAGGTLAARLTEKSTNKVLLLERPGQPPYSRMPLSFGLLIRQYPRPLALSIRARTRHGESRDSGPPRQDPGRVEFDQWPGLGTRAALDYDTWARWAIAAGAGAKWRPCSRRIENFVDGDGSNGRGTSGPLKVSTVPDQNPLYDALFAASRAAGFKLNPDYNSEKSGRASSRRRPRSTRAGA